ncbi:helix-turn-helix domain-containing protein [Kocuria marina]
MRPAIRRGARRVRPEPARFLNVSQATLSRWRREKIGPPFLRVGGVSRYNPATVRAWVTEQENDRG